jgi:hypothetical protein
VNGDAVRERFASFAPDRLAVTRVERIKKILETSVTPVVPVKLLVVTLQEPLGSQKLPFGFARKRHVNRRGFRHPAQGDESARERAADTPVVNALADQEPRSGRRGKWNRDLQFRVVASARAFIGIGPATVEHILALRVRFQIAWHDAGDSAAEPDQQMARSPAGPRAGRSGRFQCRKKCM